MTEKVVVASALCRQFEIDDVVVEALKNIDLIVEAGEFISIYGPSGAGKTTLLNLIGALDKPTSRKFLSSTMTSEPTTKTFWQPSAPHTSDSFFNPTTSSQP